METQGELEGGDPSLHLHLALRGREGAIDDSQEGALPHPVLAHHCEGLAGAHVEAHTLQDPGALVPSQPPQAQPLEDAGAPGLVTLVVLPQAVNVESELQCAARFSQGQVCLQT